MTEVSMLALTPDGELREVVANPPELPVLKAVYSAIGCSHVDVVRLPDDLDMWLDDDGQYVQEMNPYASVLGYVLAGTDQAFWGTVVFAGVRGLDTVSLTLEQRNLIAGLVQVVNG